MNRIKSLLFFISNIERADDHVLAFILLIL
jgi:hypothetical protein